MFVGLLCDWLTESEWNSKLLKVKWEEIKVLSRTFILLLWSPWIQILFITKPWREDDITSSIYLNERGVENIWISFENISNSETLCNSMIFTREDKMTSSNYMKYELGFQRIEFKALLNLFSIWNVIYEIIMHILFSCILVDPRNFTQLKDLRRELEILLFSYLRVFSNFEKRIIWFIYFIFNYFSDVKTYERGNNMTFPNLGKMKI